MDVAEAGLDLDYFRELIEISSEKRGYAEQLAMKQMNGQVMGSEGAFLLFTTLMLTHFFFLPDELVAAVDEITKNEKDEKRLAMAAKSLMEHMEEL